MSWIDTVAWELENDLKAEGIDIELTEELVYLRLNIWNYYINASTSGPEATAAQRRLIEEHIVTLRADPRLAEQPIPFRDYDADLYRRWASDIAYDPTPFIRETTVPMLYVFGENDVNVPTRESVEHIRLLQAEGRDQLSYTVYPDEGHSLQKVSRFWNTGYPSGYYEMILGFAHKHGRMTMEK
jgi:pimeloyl-ACP methyl ester carboxylesterase